MRRVAALLASVAATLLAGLGGPAPAGAAPVPKADRVLIFSVPTLGFGDVTAADMPNLSAFLDRGAIADLSVRVDDMSPSLADGYATLGAGARTLGAVREAGWGFDADESLGTSTAGDAFTRRTGVPVDGGLVYLAQPALEAANRDARFGAEVGALGDALGRSGRSYAVIANADPNLDGDDFERTAITGLSNATGQVPEGRVDRGLLVADPAAALDVRLNDDVVVAEFQSVWRNDGVVLVEASDLWRAESRRGDSDYPSAATEARRASDRLFGRLLEQVDPSNDAVLVVGPRFAGTELSLTIAALQAPGVDAGFLESPTTRRAGFVQLVDVAPTVLQLSGVGVPDVMEGRPFTVVSAPPDRRSALVAANDAARFRDAAIGPVTVAWVIAQVMLCAWAVVVAGVPRLRSARAGLAPAALLLLAVPLGLWLAQPFPFYRWGGFAYGLFVVAIAAVVALSAWLVFRRRFVDPVMVVLAGLVALLCLDVATGARLQFNTTFGYSPTIAGRFAGIGNLAYAVLGAATVFLAGLIAYRVGGRRGRWWAAALLVVVCLIDGLPFFGADVGGMLSLIPASAALLWLLAGRRIRARAVAIGGVATLAVVLLVGFLDLARPAADRSHLGRLFERVRAQGWDGLWVVLERKAAANVGVLGLSVWTLLLPVLFVLLGVLLYKAPGRLRDVKAAIPEMHATLVAFGILAVLGFALNDSGIAIPGVMLGVANTVLVFLTVRVPDPSAGEGAVNAVRETEPVG